MTDYPIKSGDRQRLITRAIGFKGLLQITAFPASQEGVLALAERAERAAARFAKGQEIYFPELEEALKDFAAACRKAAEDANPPK